VAYVEVLVIGRGRGGHSVLWSDAVSVASLLEPSSCECLKSEED
jgi:hypothetical protein